MRITGRSAAHSLAVILVTVVVSLLGLMHTVLAIGAIGAFLFLSLVSRSPSALPIVSMLAATILLRPSAFSGTYNMFGIGLAVGAAFLAWASDSRKKSHSRPVSRAARSLLVWVILLWLWTIGLGLHAQAPALQYVKGGVGVVGVLLAAIIVFRAPSRQVLFTKALVGVVLLLAAAWVVTALLWTTRGVSAGLIGPLPALNDAGTGAAADVYAPLTFVSGYTDFGQLQVSRWVVFMREPGLGQGIVAWAYFMLPAIGWNTWWRRLLLLAGIAGTLSTAGLGLFLIALVLRRYLLAPKPSLVPFKRLIGIVALPAAAWVAVTAPGFGLEAKSQTNSASITDRAAATSAGFQAMLTHPFGGANFVDQNVAINLIAAGSTIGLIGVLLALVAYLRPLFVSERKSIAMAAAIPLIGTSIAAQPVLDAPLWWLLLLLAVGVCPWRPGESPVAPVRSGHGRRGPHAAIRTRGRSQRRSSGTRQGMRNRARASAYIR